MPEINVALIGHRFMGKAHSNAYRQLRHFFPGKLEPRMKVICGRERETLEAARQQFGWEEIETDWRKAVEREDIQLVDISTPGNLHA
jgi:predicted dehydrogenase